LEKGKKKREGERFDSGPQGVLSWIIQLLWERKEEKKREESTGSNGRKGALSIHIVHILRSTKGLGRGGQRKRGKKKKKGGGKRRSLESRIKLIPQFLVILGEKERGERSPLFSVLPGTGPCEGRGERKKRDRWLHPSFLSIALQERGKKKKQNLWGATHLP